MSDAFIYSLLVRAGDESNSNPNLLFSILTCFWKFWWIHRLQSPWVLTVSSLMIIHRFKLCYPALSEDMGRSTPYTKARGGARCVWGWEESAESRSQHMEWLRRDQQQQFWVLSIHPSPQIDRSLLRIEFMSCTRSRQDTWQSSYTLGIWGLCIYEL